MTARLPHRAVLPVLALVAALLLAGCGDDGSPAQAGDEPSTSTSTGAGSSSPADTSSSPAEESATPGLSAYAVYDVGTTPQGPRLFREFRNLPAPQAAPVAIQALTSRPTDPDYRTLWPDGAFVTAADADGQIDVTIAASVVQRPSGMTADEAALAIQQVVYTMQAAAQQQLPVRFLLGDAPSATVLGVPTADPVAAADAIATLALVNITTPTQEAMVSGTFTASGVASSFEGTVPWEVLDGTGKRVLRGSAQGTMDFSKLTPWKARVDVSGLAPGDYTFVAMTDDSSGGEGGGPTKDTKAIIVS